MSKWFTKTKGVEKGPYEAAAIQKSLDDKRIGPLTLIRGEGESDFVPVNEHPHFRRIAKKRSEAAMRSRRDFDPERDVVPARGDFGLGILAGLFGGCIGFILVLAIAKGEATKKGALAGFVVQMAIGLFMHFAMKK